MKTMETICENIQLNSSTSTTIQVRDVDAKKLMKKPNGGRDRLFKTTTGLS